MAKFWSQVLSGLPVKIGLPPHKDIGPRLMALPAFAFTSAITSFTFDLTEELTNSQLDMLQCLYIDNTQNSRAVRLTLTGTNYGISVPQGCHGVFHIPSTNGLEQFTLTSTGQGTVSVWAANYFVDSMLFGANGPNGLVNDVSGTFTGSSQLLLPRNPSRTGLLIVNQSATAMAVNFNAAAVIAGAGSISLSTVGTAGSLLALNSGNCPLDPVYVIGTLSGNFTCKEIY